MFAELPHDISSPLVPLDKSDVFDHFEKKILTTGLWQKCNLNSNFSDSAGNATFHRISCQNSIAAIHECNVFMFLRILRLKQFCLLFSILLLAI